MLEDFKQHPAVAPLIAGGKLVEYSAHVVPEAGINMLPELVGDGVLIAGDAAGMCMNSVLPFAVWIWRLPPGKQQQNCAFSDESDDSVSKTRGISSAS